MSRRTGPRGAGSVSKIYAPCSPKEALIERIMAYHALLATEDKITKHYAHSEGQKKYMPLNFKI